MAVVETRGGWKASPKTSEAGPVQASRKPEVGHLVIARAIVW